MNLKRQIGLTLVLVACATIAAARYYPVSHTILDSLGVPQPLLTMIAKRDDADTTGPAGTARGGGGPRAAVVTTAQVFTGAISTKVQAVGSSEALRSVSVVPLEAGVLRQVAVQSGDLVQAGDLLAQMNADTEEITRDRAAVALKSAQAEYARYEGLSQSNAASQIELDTLRAAQDDAALALREAEVALEQRSIVALIDGVVGIVPVEIGDYVTAETEIALIDDRTQVVVDFWVPERLVGTVAIGQSVKASPLALSGQNFAGKVSATGSRVDTDSRTLQVRALVDNPDDVLRPGMSFAISMSFDGETYPAVPPLAVQWDADGSYVWMISDGTAQRTPARIVQRNADAVLLEADITEGALVITEGVLNVRDGAAVTVEGAGAPNDDVVDADDARATPIQVAPSEIEG